jgi:ABC-type bacteriocin/lantibiotic exporter with double-glycine peptidase domain
VIGPSGAGKSTLLALLLGLLEPERGSVEYGDRSIGHAEPAWFRRVAYVPQDVFVLDDSVAANVALGDSRPDQDRILESLERAHLSEVVGTMADGLDTELGEAGSRLSVGQRQRLGIARALYRRASVLLLDEPTAALDPESEARIIDTLAELHGEVTIVLISHRPLPLNGADRVVRLEHGALVEVELDKDVGGVRT